MSVVLGSAQLVGQQVIITPPGGDLGGFNAVRLSNYSGDLLILTNINSDRPGQEYLLPFQQNVYRIENLRTPPVVLAAQLGNAFPTETVLVEWATDALTDLPGTYPTSLTQGGIVAASPPMLTVSRFEVVDDGTHKIIAANTARASITVINDGTEPLKWDYQNGIAGDWTNAPLINVGDGFSLNTSAAIYFHGAGSGNSFIKWFATGYLPETIVA